MKNIFLLLSLCLMALITQAQTCADTYGYPSCDSKGPLSAYPGDSISVYDTIALSNNPINEYFLDVNTCNASIVLIDSIGYSDYNYTQRVVLIAQTTGNFNIRLSTTAVYDTCSLNATCAAAVTVVDPTNPLGRHDKPLFAQVAPNPSIGNPVINIKGMTGPATLTVFKADAKNIYSRTVQNGETVIGITTPGFYHYKIIDSKHVTNGKFIIL